MTDRIWAAFCNMKFKAFVLGLLVQKYQIWDRNINIFLALSSSGSIAAWAVWQKHTLIWGFIIAASQVVTTIKPFFPYQKIVKELNAKSLHIDILNIEFEDFWNKANKRKLTENEMEAQLLQFNKSYASVLNFSDDLLFTTTSDIENKANHRMKVFLKTFYNIDINPQKV